MGHRQRLTGTLRLYRENGGGYQEKYLHPPPRPSPPRILMALVYPGLWVKCICCYPTFSEFYDEGMVPKSIFCTSGILFRGLRPFAHRNLTCSRTGATLALPVVSLAEAGKTARILVVLGKLGPVGRKIISGEPGGGSGRSRLYFRVGCEVLQEINQSKLPSEKGLSQFRVASYIVLLVVVEPQFRAAWDGLTINRCNFLWLRSGRILGSCATAVFETSFVRLAPSVNV